jgi:hypothetical protein
MCYAFGTKAKSADPDRVDEPLKEDASNDD